jgi:hypothetical protein
MEPVMEIVNVPRAISGGAIIDDLLNRIGERLSRDCSLRETDAYQGYDASVQITLQLHDVYPVEVAAQVNVGTIDPAQKSERIAMNAPMETGASFEPAPNLERYIDPAGAPAEPETPERRQYISRIRGHGTR